MKVTRPRTDPTRTTGTPRRVAAISLALVVGIALLTGCGAGKSQSSPTRPNLSPAALAAGEATPPRPITSPTPQTPNTHQTAAEDVAELPQDFPVLKAYVDAFDDGGVAGAEAINQLAQGVCYDLDHDLNALNALMGKTFWNATPSEDEALAFNVVAAATTCPQYIDQTETSAEVMGASYGPSPTGPATTSATTTTGNSGPHGDGPTPDYTGLPPTGSPAAVLDIGGRNESSPSTIAFSGDSGNIATQLVWSNWGSGTATATGIVDIQGCVPDCASGSETPTQVDITITNLTGGEYQSLTESVVGMPPQNYNATQLTQLGS